MSNSTITDFQKLQIMECYEAMKKFVSDMEIEDENKYYDLYYMIETKKIALPDNVHQAFMTFLEEVVETYVFADHIPEFTPDEAEYNEENGLVIKTEEAAEKLAISFMMELAELDDKIECFAEKELKPYLWS